MKKFNLKKIFYIIRFRLERKMGLLKNTAPASGTTKQNTVKQYGEKHDCEVLIETGTYRGDMIEAVKENFNKIYSVELGKELCLSAKQRFSNSKHIEILCGDSASILPDILKKINTKALFWLDAHHSGGDTSLGEETTPIITELTCLLQHPYPKVILIDDARLFNGIEYPTVGRVKKLVKKLSPKADFQVSEDIIRILT